MWGEKKMEVKGDCKTFCVGREGEGVTYQEPSVRLYVAGHNIWETGRKLHLKDTESGKVLCGLSGYQGNYLWEETEILKVESFRNPEASEEYIQNFNEDLLKWIDWMDNANCGIELCKRCRKIALDRIRGKKNEVR